MLETVLFHSAHETTMVTLFSKVTSLCNEWMQNQMQLKMKQYENAATERLEWITHF